MFLDDDAEYPSDLRLFLALPGAVRYLLPLSDAVGPQAPFWISFAASSLRDWDAAGVVVTSRRITVRATMARSDRLGSVTR